MKQFMYIEEQDGGMDIFYDMSDLANDLKYVYAWMDPLCRHEDEQLLKWAETADVGEYCEHRKGVLIRIKDFEE